MHATLFQRLTWARGVFVLCGALLAFAAVKQARAAVAPDFAVEGRLHLVQNGEDLLSIAEAQDLELAALLQLNDMDETDALWTGQPLRLPAASAPGPSLAALNGIYRVGPGETLHSIAVQYGLHPVELAHINRMAPNEVLFAGQELRVPSLNNWTKLLERGYMQQFPTHVVGDSESLASIARQFGVREEDVRRFNALAPAAEPETGSELMIPPLDTVVSLRVNAVNPESLGQLVRLKERWVEIDLAAQQAIAYEGMTPIRRMDVSTGKPSAPTATGLFRIWAKTEVQDMSQGSRTTDQYEFLDDVPWVQYFYRDFAIHGAYWPLSEGTPSSNGNVLLREDDAEWLFGWTSPNGQSGFEARKGWVLGDAPQSGTLLYIHE